MAPFNLVCRCGYVMLILLTSLLKSNSVWAQNAEAAPNAKAWKDSISQDRLTAIKGPTMLTFVKEFSEGDKAKGRPVFLDFDIKTCGTDGFISCASKQNAEFSLQINNPAVGLGLTGAAAVTGANGVVYVADKKVFLSDAQGKHSTPLKIKIADFEKGVLSQISNQVFAALRYHGVVIDKKGPFILVGSTSKTLSKPSLQALTLASSEDLWVLDESSKRDGASLYVLDNHSDGFGVFQEVVSGKNDTPVVPGTKIIIETK
jgi:hypothetical protein